MTKRSVRPDIVVTEVDLDLDPITLSDGTVLDETSAERYGRRVADGAAERRARPGRPSLSGDASTSPRVSARLSARTYSRLVERARAEHKPISDVIREALEHYV